MDPAAGKGLQLGRGSGLAGDYLLHGVGNGVAGHERDGTSSEDGRGVSSDPETDRQTQMPVSSMATWGAGGDGAMEMKEPGFKEERSVAANARLLAWRRRALGVGGRGVSA